MGVLQRAASRFLGLATPEDVKNLQDQIGALETRVKMRASGSGVPIMNGHFTYEYLDSLNSQARWQIYDKMETDPRIKEGLDSIKLPLMTGKWLIEAASDKAIDKEIRDFVAANLLRESTDKYGREYWLQTSWAGQRLPEILDFQKCGYAMFCKSTRVVEGKVIYDRLQWLEPQTVDPHGWVIGDNDDLISVKRTYRTPQQNYEIMAPLLAEQLMLYVWDMKGARYEGRPKIRSLYGAFTRKDFMVRNAVIWAQKVGSPMPVAHYPANLPSQHIPLVEKAVMASRGQSPAEAYAMFPMGPGGEKVEITFPALNAGEVDRMRGLIEAENAEIAHGSGTKQQLLGETASGSRNLGESVSADEDINTQAVALLICETENHGVGNLPGTIQQLIEWNFPDVKNFPQIQVSRIGPTENFKTLTPMIQAIVAGIIPLTPELRKQVTEKFGITLKDSDYAKPPEPLGLVPRAEGNASKDAPSPADAGKPAGGADSTRPKAAPDPKAGVGALVSEDFRTSRHLDLRLGIERMLQADSYPNGPSVAAPTSTGFWRAPTRFESKVCLLGAVSGTLQTGAEQVGSAMRRATGKMVEDILVRVESGQVTREATTGLRRARPKGEAAMKDEVQKRFLDVARVGIQQAQEELTRQKALADKVSSGVTTPFSVFGLSNLATQDEQTSMLPAGAMIPIAAAIAVEIQKLIDRSGGSWQVRPILTAELAAEARIASGIAIDEIWSRLLDEAIREFNLATRSGLSEAEAVKRVEQALHALSPAKGDLAARQVAEVAYNAGRDVAAKEAAVNGEAQWVVRTEAVESPSCCATCRNLDGIYLKIGTPAYEQYRAPSFCDGGDSCRGFNVIVSASLAKLLDEGTAR